MSQQSDRFLKTRSAKVNSQRDWEFVYEIEEYFKKANTPKPKVFSASPSSRKNCHDLTDRWYRSQFYAYIIMGGSPARLSLEDGFYDSYYEDYPSQVMKLATLCTKIWGGFASPPLDQDLMGRVIEVLDWEPRNEDDLIQLVSFVNALPTSPVEDWEITGDWQSWKKCGKLTFTVENPDEGLTVERVPQLKNYSFDVLRVAKQEIWDKTQTFIPLMGVELEFTHSDYSLATLLPVLGMGIFKSDSTTDVEFVTVPLEYEDLVSQFKKRELAFSRMLQNNGAETNGMHIHVSRKSISLAQEARIYYLVNAKRNRNYWTKIADRDVANNNYASFASLSGKLINAVKNNDYAHLGQYDFPNYRTCTVNRENSHTLEFRLFKSPDNLDQVLENLRVVQAVLDYTSSGGYSLPGFNKFMLARD